MNFHVTPLFQNFWTDIFSGMTSFQSHPTCANRELQVVDCLEANGVYHGQTRCRIVLDDFRECVMGTKSRHRVNIMGNERMRQVQDGERDPKDMYAQGPQLDTF